MARFSKRNKDELDNLQSFAKRVENQIIAANMKGQETMERLICRLLTGKKSPQVAAAMAQKWVEWRYGKAIQPISGKDGEPIQLQVVTNATFPEP